MNRGKHYEDRAESLLRAAGLHTVARNYRCKRGEIDIICRDGDTLVFVEVRYRSHPGFASAAASVTPAKQRRLQAAAQFYLQQHRLSNSQACRFDVIAFDASGCAGKDEIQWLRNAISS